MSIENKEIHIEKLSREELISLAKNQEFLIGKSKTTIEQSEIKIQQSEIKIQQSEIKIQQSLEKIAILTFQLEQMKRAMFGSKSERFISNPNQLALLFDLNKEAIESAVEQEKEKIKVSFERIKAARKPHPGRNIIPENYPRIDVIVAPDFDTTGMKIIGQEITEELDLTPAKMIVTRYIRNKYISVAKEDGIQVSKIASLDFRPIPKCIAGVNLLTELAVSKHIDHLPIYRQTAIYKRHGIDIPSSTIESWVNLTATFLQPLYAAHRQSVLNNGYLQVDESSIKVQDKSKEKNIHTGFMWVYHAPLQKGVLFEYHPSRGAESVRDTLTNFKGYLQTDGYQVYDKTGQKATVTHLGCWAHVRRKFEKALTSDNKRSAVVMEYIQHLYEVESHIRAENLIEKDAKELRLKDSLRITNQIGKYISDLQKIILPKSPLGEAVAYALNRWDSLQNYLHDPKLLIDNNPIENAIRPLALGRKNYLFAGSHDAAKNIAMYYSFFATCKKHEINPTKWLRYILENLNDTKSSQVYMLLPQHINKKLVE